MSLCLLELWQYLYWDHHCFPLLHFVVTTNSQTHHFQETLVRTKLTAPWRQSLEMVLLLVMSKPPWSSFITHISSLMALTQLFSNLLKLHCARNSQSIISKALICSIVISNNFLYSSLLLTLLTNQSFKPPGISNQFTLPFLPCALSLSLPYFHQYL